MSKKRVFPSKNVSTKAEDYHGGARYKRIIPDIASQGVQSINIEIPFDEALKLSLALESCLMQLNRYHRGTAVGRKMGGAAVNQDRKYVDFGYREAGLKAARASGTVQTDCLNGS